ncbi:hypothetical protein BKA57DRAFT_499364 [Linnemannia elongata]|nr:hypothetical protein BKA57DRAFT_499364 [Linnemannia elongata]
MTGPQTTPELASNPEQWPILCSCVCTTRYARRWLQLSSTNIGLKIESKPYRQDLHQLQKWPDFVRNIMQEADVDLSGIKPVKLTAELAKTVSTIVTLGCGEACPDFPGVDVVEWKLADSKDRSLDGAREMRNEIENKVKVFIAESNY